MGDLTNMVRDDGGRFLKSLREIRPEHKAAETARQMILRRTRQGFDRHGKPFAPYKPRTIQIKRRKGQQANPVNLTDTGGMLGSLVVKSDQGSASYTVHQGRTRRVAQVTVVDRKEERKLRFHVFGTKHMAARDIVGLTPREERSLFRQFQSDVQRAAPEDRHRRIQLKVFSP